jgi:hypothetical protein
MYYYKFFKIVYEKTAYKDTIFSSENLWINIKVNLFASTIFISSKISQIQTGPKTRSIAICTVHNVFVESQRYGLEKVSINDRHLPLVNPVLRGWIWPNPNINTFLVIL